ncbi:putative uncharacterized protein DDB_G0271606 [Watersipora subatra]|uniref:putative uncharacterized protein DDB_G0271606 n=1 Tax=Watersipora subatra TaxID=2589382 RepID=UPI00355B7864
MEPAQQMQQPTPIIPPQMSLHQLQPQHILQPPHAQPLQKMQSPQQIHIPQQMVPPQQIEPPQDMHLPQQVQPPQCAQPLQYIQSPPNVQQPQHTQPPQVQPPQQILLSQHIQLQQVQPSQQIELSQPTNQSKQIQSSQQFQSPQQVHPQEQIHLSQEIQLPQHMYSRQQGQPLQQIQPLQVQPQLQIQPLQYMQSPQQVQPLQQIQSPQQIYLEQHIQPSQPVQLPQQIQPLQQIQSTRYMQQLPLETQPQTSQNETNKLKSTTLRWMKILSQAQVVLGACAVLFGSILLAVDETPYEPWIALVSYGIWSGVFFVVVGGFGLAAAKHNTYNWVRATMIFNIVCSAVFFFPLITMSSIALNLNSIPYYECLTPSSCGYFRGSNSALALNSLLLIISIAELVINIWTAILCCQTVCNCCQLFHPAHASTALQNHQNMTESEAIPAYQAYQKNQEFPTASDLVDQQPVDSCEVQPQVLHAYDGPEQPLPDQNQGYQQSLPVTMQQQTENL